MLDGRWGVIQLFVNHRGEWFVRFGEGGRERALGGKLDSRQAQAGIAKFMTALAALAARRAKVGDGYAIDAMVPPPSTGSGEVVQLLLGTKPPR